MQPRRDRELLAFALAVSVYIHAMILALRFGAAGFGVPWAEQRAQPPQITVRLVEAPRPPAPAPQLALRPTLELGAPPSTVIAAGPKPVMPARADTSLEVSLASDAVRAPTQPSAPRREARKPAAAAKARTRDQKIRPKPRPKILAQRDAKQETFKVPPRRATEPEEQRAPEIVAKKQSAEPPTAVQPTELAAQAEDAARIQAEASARERAEEDARQRAVALQQALEAKKQAEAQRAAEAKQQDDARRQTLELEARKLAEESARQEAEELARQSALALQKEQDAKKQAEARKLDEARKQEAARLQEELKKQEEARRIALKLEALKRAEDLAKQHAAARQQELEAQRLAEEAAARAKQTADRQRADAEAAAQRERLAAPAGPGPAPGALSGHELAAKALEQFRNPGAARGDPARPSAPFARFDTRRRSVFGVERDVSVRMYVDSWRWKIERNGPLNYRASASWRASENPIVTVSIRSDGSLADVSIHRSSGVRELDEAVRRIARLQAPYAAFPPDLARQYDVLDIRRVWSFENTLKILDEISP